MFTRPYDFYRRLEKVLRTSKAVIYQSDNQQRTYPELYSEILKFNSVFSRFKGGRVAHYTEKTFSAYAAIYATLLSENTWVPLTPSAPPLRNLEIIKVCEPSMILTDAALPLDLLNFAKIKNIPVLNLSDVLRSEKERPLDLGEFREDDIAYIMFTSGSSGVPKGVPMSHKNYIPFIDNAMALLPFRSHEVFSDFHDFAFDISIFYLFCCVLTESAFAPIRRLEDKIIPLKFIEENKISVWSSVPSVIQRIQALKPNQKMKTSVRIMFLCGEPFRLDLLKYCFENLNLENVFNFYGLTETGVENFYHACTREDLRRFQDKSFVPIGKPLPGNDIRIGDNQELLLKGPQVMSGHLGGIGNDRFEIIDEATWFHTGDIVEKFDDVYFCKGRMDSQVKLSGFRVELMDIEAHLRATPLVEEAVCFVHEGNAQKTLVAAVKAREASVVDTLPSQLALTLPPYMIPKQFIFLSEIPLNSNGKIDRKRIKDAFQWEGKVV